MEGKKTAGRQKISLVKIDKYANRLSTFSKRRSGLYKKGSELVRENDVDLGIVLSSPTDKSYSFIHPTSNAVIDRFMNSTTELSVGEQLVAANTRKKVNQLNDRLNEFDRRGKAANEKIRSLDQVNKARDIGRWESIDQLNADDIIKFEAWLNVGEYMLKEQENEASSSSQFPSEDAHI